jgi:hypothetical protein
MLLPSLGISPSHFAMVLLKAWLGHRAPELVQSGTVISSGKLPGKGGMGLLLHWPTKELIAICCQREMGAWQAFELCSLLHV